ncbi:MAG: cupin domain-containing protein [Porticoccaceae bacterium]
MSQKPEILFQSEAVLVRLMTLAPNEIGQRHYHTCLFETVICTEGMIALHVDERQPAALSEGEQASVSPPQAHHLQNLGREEARYILVQAGGAYDFLPIALTYGVTDRRA